MKVKFCLYIFQMTLGRKRTKVLGGMKKIVTGTIYCIRAVGKAVAASPGVATGAAATFGTPTDRANYTTKLVK